MPRHHTSQIDAGPWWVWGQASGLLLWLACSNCLKILMAKVGTAKCQ